MVSVNYALKGSNGDVIAFDYENYVMNPDFVGFNMAPSQVRIEQSAGDGGVFRHSKKGVRNLDIPVTILGTDRADVQEKLRRLSRLLQDTSGPTILQANYSNDETLEMSAHYVGGAEGQWGTSAGMVWNRWVLSMQAPNPYWDSNLTETFTVGTGNTGRGLLPQLTKLRLTSSQVFGVITAVNNGDVPAFPVWAIRGPLSEVVISNGTQSFSFNTDILDGETITVNTADGTVVDDSGNNRYPILGPAPKLFRIPPGTSSLTVNGVAATSEAQVTLTYSPRYEVVH